MNSTFSKYLLACLVLVGLSTSAWAQTPPMLNDTTRYIDKIPHWLSVHQFTAQGYLQTQRNQFKAKAYIETYVEASLDYNTWLINLLNQFTVLRSLEARNNPHIVFNIKFRPANDQLNNYTVVFAMSGSPQVQVNFNTIAMSVQSLYFTGKTFPDPGAARDQVASALSEAMRLVAQAVGNSLSPNLMVKTKGEIFWNGHEILIDKNGDNQLTLQPLAKFGKPLRADQVQWTNATAGLVDMSGQQTKTVTLSRTDTTASLTVNIKRRTGFAIDLKSLLRPIMLQVLQEKLTQVLDSVGNTRMDSVANANDVSAFIAELEKDNIAIEAGGTLVPLFAQPISLVGQDTADFTNDSPKGKAFNALRKRKRTANILRTKLNVAALINLLIAQPDRLDELLDELIVNSGSLFGQLVLNGNEPNFLQTARNTIIVFLNNNLTRVAGSTFGMAPDEPITVHKVQSNSGPRFNPAQRLYISEHVKFPGKEQFVSEMTTYLATQTHPLYVFVNYSQDVSQAAYLARSTGTRPAGLPPGAHYLTMTVVNTPGSVMAQAYSSSGCELDAGNSGLAKNFKDCIKSYASARLAFEQQLQEQVGADFFNFACVTQAYDRYTEAKKKYGAEQIAMYASAVRFWLCATSKENCKKDPYKCGFINALLQEIDWITLVDKVSEFEMTREDIDAFLTCLVTEMPIGKHPSDPTTEDVIVKCLTGTSLTDIEEAIKTYISENLDEPYFQGQVTAFALTMLSPLKAGIIKKLEKLPAFASRISKFRRLSGGKNADELVNLAKGGLKIPKLGEKLNVSDYSTSAKNSVKVNDTRSHSFSCECQKIYGV